MMEIQKNRWDKLRICAVISIGVLLGVGGLIGFNSRVAHDSVQAIGPSSEVSMIVPSGLIPIEATNWTDIQNAVSTASGDLLIEVMNDINAGAEISIPAGIHVYLRSNSVSLNVYSIFQNTSNNRHFIVDSGSLSIGDIRLTKPSFDWFSSGGLTVDNSGLLEMFTGSVVSNIFSGWFSVVHIQHNSYFTMYGGEISNNWSANHGGGVGVWWDSTFTMNGGEISGNWGQLGAGVAVIASSFTMNEGVISNNEEVGWSHGGGGVAVMGITGVFTMNGGQIINNEAPMSGGGVTVMDATTFTMNGGVISGNIVPWGGGGGGVYVENGSSFNMNTGQIINNRATYGGGIFADNFGDLNISSTAIFSGNMSDSSQAHDWFLSPDFPSGIVPFWQSGWTGVSAGLGGSVANIQWASTSIAGTHLLNNYDINFVGAPISYQIVTFNPNGGIFSNAIQSQDQSQVRLVSQIADADTPTYSLIFDTAGDLQNLFLSRPIRAGYTFGGWFDSIENANGTTGEGRVLSVDDITSEGSRTLYARWIEKIVDENIVPDVPNSGIHRIEVTGIVSTILILSLLLSSAVGFKWARD